MVTNVVRKMKNFHSRKARDCPECNTAGFWESSKRGKKGKCEFDGIIYGRPRDGNGRKSSRQGWVLGVV